MKPRYSSISDAEATELMRRRIAEIKSLLKEINETLKEAGGRE